MTGYDACCLFRAMKLHFAPGKYDFFKYQGKARCITSEAFEHHRDRWSFRKLAKLYPTDDGLKFFLAANFFECDVNWVRDLLSEESNRVYLEKRRIQESLEYIVTGDIGYLFEHDFKSLFKVVNGEYPQVLTMTLQKAIHKETLIVLNSVMGFFPVWERKVADTIIFPTFKHKCIRYAPFLTIDVKKFREALLLKLSSTK